MPKTVLFTAGYKIIPEKKLLIDARFGKVTIEGLMEYKKILTSDPHHTELLIKLVDTREMDWDCTISDVSNYIKGLARLRNGLSKTNKAAGVYRSVHQKAYTYAINKAFISANQNQEYFTELAEALEWLECPMDSSEIEKIILEIKENPQFIWQA